MATNSSTPINPLPNLLPASGIATATPTAPRSLFRHPTEKRLGGVCGGIADYFAADPMLVRILCVVAAFVTFGGSLAVYGLLWLLLPVGTQAQGQREAAPVSLREGNMRWAAWILIGLGVVWLLANIGILAPLWAGAWTVLRILFWPVVLVAVGIVILRSSRHGRSLTQDVKERLPDADSIKQSLNDARQRIPLKRSRENRILLGVCGGLARTFKVDATVVRLLWALFSLGSLGAGVIIYVIAAIIMPEDDPAAIEITDVEVLDPIS